MDTPINDQTLHAFFQYLTNLANKKLADAGRACLNARESGMSDGGAGALLDQINVYKAGMDRRIPKEWKRKYDKFTAIRDPEYTEYVRLTKKFADKGV